jgi:hypothetical protein
VLLRRGLSISATSTHTSVGCTTSSVRGGCSGGRTGRGSRARGVKR